MLEGINKTKLITFLISIFLVQFIGYLLSSVFLEVSLDVIRFLQGLPFLYNICKYIIFIGSKTMKYTMFIFVFSFCNYYHTFLYSMVLFSSLFYASFVKILFQEMRPYWVDNSIMSYDCEISYSFPSNHIQTTIPVFLFFWDIVYSRFEIDKADDSYCFDYKIGLISVNILVLLQGFAQLFYGAQTIDQILFGIIVGYMIYYFFISVLNFSVDDYQPIVDLIIDSKQIYLYLLTYFFMYFIFLIFLILKYPVNDEVYVNFMQENCQEYVKYTPFLKCFVDSAEYFGFLGTISAIMVEKMKYNLSEEPSKIMLFIAENLNEDNKSTVGHWNNTSCWLSFVRFLILFIETYFLLFSLRYISMMTESYLLTYFLFEKAIPSFLICFLLFNLFKLSTVVMKVSNLSLTDEDNPLFKRKQSSKKSLLNNFNLK